MVSSLRACTDLLQVSGDSVKQLVQILTSESPQLVSATAHYYEGCAVMRVHAGLHNQQPGFEFGTLSCFPRASQVDHYHKHTVSRSQQALYDTVNASY